MQGRLQKIFGRNLYAYREQFDLSQEGLGQRLGFNEPRYAGELERGNCNVTLGTLERYAHALRIDPYALLQVDPSAAADPFPLLDEKLPLVKGRLQKTLGRNVRNYRDRQQISCAELAEKLLRSRSGIAAIEQGARNMSFDKIGELAEKLGLDPLALLYADLEVPA